MNKFMYYFSFFLALALNIRAIQLHSVSYTPSSYVEIGNKISNEVGDMWNSKLDSFIELVSNKVVDKLENSLSNEKISKNMMILLENEAELFDAHHYKGQDLALIQTIFFNKLKDKFKNSKFMTKVRALGTKAKNKIMDLYKKHKSKLSHFFKTLMKSLVLPLAIQFIRKNMNKWKNMTLNATNKLDDNSKKIAEPVIESLYKNMSEKIDNYADTHKVNFDDELKALDELEKDKKEIERIEKQEEQLLKQS